MVYLENQARSSAYKKRGTPAKMPPVYRPRKGELITRLRVPCYEEEERYEEGKRGWGGTPRHIVTEKVLTLEQP